MFRYGPLHAIDGDVDALGRARAITIFRQSEHGVLVIAGRLHETSAAKPGAQITRMDYCSGQRVSFGDWRSIWGYFAGSEFEPLLMTIRARITEIEREGPLPQRSPDAASPVDPAT